ncbi:MAG: PAS domain S-box protein [wastewater metagenome]|nr:PAS domain S-box protein [Candidatus Loosdrechtia aerotolerans]
MKIFPFKSIRNRLILIFLLCSFLPLLLLRFMAFPKAQKDLEEALIRNLEGVQQKQAEILKTWFEERRHDAKVVSKNISAFIGNNISTNDKENAFQKLYDYMEMLKKEYVYERIDITSQDGTILASTEKERVGSAVIRHDYCREALNGNIFVSRIQQPAETGNGDKGNAGIPIMFISAPLMNTDATVGGAVILRISTAPLSEIMKTAKLGRSGETFLMNREGYMLTESRFAGDLKEAGLIRERTALELRVVNPRTGKLTKGAQKCLNFEDGYDTEGYIDYDGKRVLGAWCWIPEYDCGLLAQIDIYEGYGAAYGLKKFVLSTLLILALPLILIAFYFSKRISAPILNITEVTKRITGGDLAQRVKASRKKDEISELAQAFNIMAESLEEKTIKLRNYTTDLENTVRERTLELQQTTNFLNSILAGSTEYSIIAQDLDGNILAFNKGASIMYGYDSKEVAGKVNVRMLHLEEDVEAGMVDSILESARKTGRYEGEVMRRRKNGEIFPVHVTFTLRRDENGRPIGFVVVSKDITKERLVELEKDIVNNINKIIASSLDIKEIYLYIYTELKRIIDIAWLGVVHLVDGTEITENFHIMNGAVYSPDWLKGIHYPLETTAQGVAISKNKPVFITDTSAERYFIDQELARRGVSSYLCFPLKSKGITIGTITLGSKERNAFTDIHFSLLNQITSQLAIAIENARLFVSIKESEKKYRDLVENAPEMIHEISSEGKFINVNKTELNKLGYSLEEMRQMTLEDIVPEGCRKEIRRYIGRVIETGSGELETVFLTKSRKEINVEINGTALYNKNAGCICTRAFVRDITERKDMEEQMRQSEKLASMGELAAAIAHEIRNPLGAICNSVGILDAHLKLTGQDKDLLEMIVEQSERLDRIISDFLTFAHPRVPSFSLYNIREVIKNTIFLLEQDSRYTDRVEIKEIYESVLPKVYIDPDLIHQVLWNLFINALDVMPDGGQIKVMVRKTTLFLRDAIEIIMSDTGRGIPPHDLDKIFEPFYTTKSEGTGLGLSVVQRIIDDHGGTIDVKSKVDRGTTFHIKFPVNPIGNEK